MYGQRKKPRQRNRPRNKANRAKDVPETKNAPTRDNVNSDRENSVQNDNEPSTPVAFRALTEAIQLTSAPAAQPATRPQIDSNEAIRIIQQLMRAKLLTQETRCNEHSEIDANNQLATPIVPDPSLASSTMTPAAASMGRIKAKEKYDESSTNSAFIENLQKKMEMVMTNGGADLPIALFGNLQNLIGQDPVRDVESSDDENDCEDNGEYIEYIYKPRQYFLVSLCNFCKCDLRGQELVPCTRCKMTYYCTPEHMRNDESHRQLCYALRQVADYSGNHIFHKCNVFTTEQFRSYRIVTIRKVEAAINRTLTATEQEVILFPRLCGDIKCREYRFNKLIDCRKCGQVAYCRDKPEHLSKQHHGWCQSYQLFKELVMFQEKFGRLEPSLPTKVLKDIPGACSSTRQILNKLSFDMQDPCEYAVLSQISTGPLTAWYALKLCDQLKKNEVITVHLIGAEIEFEVDVLHKWELFFLHLVPTIKELNVLFVGPELNPKNISFEQLKRTKCCRDCRKNGRTVRYHFESQIYHDYCKTAYFLKPDLICFFNPGLYRSTGYQMEDTWPETILAAAQLKCPVVVTSYTAHEAPLDMTRFVQESNRRLNVALPPTVNPFASDKPERNFISDGEAPLMFKNYYCFVVE